ncbi:iron-containing alcohol dehydrogenase PsrA [Methylocapsa sp. S129]|uniref:iron-containing alcohol dehydrogenase PsrA n=1 Tax=Methylocapsa sp. S129 TaxID=1641869 RepID=UPI00131DF466|nr:iron-containing alcohol dehydrogenase PsrA [Methylocapsa sp. S129]
MTSWTFRNPVRITFGLDALNEIGTLVAGRGYLLVTHPDAPFKPLSAQVARLAGPPLAMIDGIEPNPSLAMLRNVCAKVQALPKQPEVLVALGGGSVIDSTKFLAVGHGEWAPVVRYLETGIADSRRALPFIAVPTTAGTGSDVTRWATIWDPEKQRKLSLARDDLYAEAALVDPGLTASLPWPTSLASGLDALSHALESIWNRNANPITRGFATLAARDIMEGLKRLSAGRDNLDARRQLALGALRAGLAFSNTQTALAHNISYALTLERGVTHGIACSFCLPEVMKAALGVDPACDAALADIFGDAAQAPAALRSFLDALGVSPSPGDYGLSESQWNRIVVDAFDGPRGRNFISSLDRFPLRARPPATAA